MLIMRKMVEDKESSTGDSRGTIATIRLTRAGAGALLLAVLLPWVAVAYLVLHRAAPPANHAAEPSQALPRHEIVSGPWGALDIEPIILDYPSSHTIFDFDLELYRKWMFQENTLDSVRQRLAKAGLSAASVEALLKTAVADPGSKGFVLHPPDAVVRDLTPATRAALYADLAHDPANQPQVRPFMFRGATIEEWFAGSGVSSAVMGQVKPLIYRRENYLLFSDPQLVVPAIESRFERVRLYRALRRTATLRVRIHMNEGATPESILDYWGHPNRASEIEPLLTALASRHDGLSIVTFLPVFARSRLYTYPDAHLHEDTLKHDCHWCALNFFNNPPDDRMGPNIASILTQEYEAVSSPTQLGDIVLLFDGDRLVHSCVYLAGDIVFTKNGIGMGDPFVLEKLDDVVHCYRGIYGNIRLAFCRRKGT